MQVMSFSSTPPDEPVFVQRGPAPRTDEPVLHLAADRGVFFTATTALYASSILLVILAANPYFAQTWDVSTFIQAGHRFLDGGNPFDLYAQTRAAQTWPYAYPPLHALVVALALFGGNVLHLLPDFVWARVPALVADIGIGIFLYAVVERKTTSPLLAQMALVLWLFNPITLYDTAIQGHFESEWLIFVLLAYVRFENSEGRDLVLTSIALAIAVLFKQTAILFAIPLWIFIVAGTGPAWPLPRRLRHLVLSGLVFGIVVGVICLPYLLFSSDFLYMNLTYVENIPVQTQSWIVALLGLTRSSGNALTSDFLLLRFQMLGTLLAVAGMAFWAARRGWNLYLTGSLVAIIFFLTSKKVMGYYYVMLFPFLLIECLPRRRFDLLLVAFTATAWISLSPYYAGWASPEHLWIYAVLGTVNSLLFVWMFVQLVRGPGGKEIPANPRVTLFTTLGLFAAAVLAVFMQPLVQSSGSPIRAPIIMPGMEGSAGLAFVLVVILLTPVLALIARRTREIGGKVGMAAWGVVWLFVPLFFAVYTLTKESTAILEIALKTLGG